MQACNQSAARSSDCERDGWGPGHPLASILRSLLCSAFIGSHCTKYGPVLSRGLRSSDTSRSGSHERNQSSAETHQAGFLTAQSRNAIRIAVQNKLGAQIMSQTGEMGIFHHLSQSSRGV